MVVAVCNYGGRLNRLPSATVGDMVLTSVKKGKPELRKKVMPAVVCRMRAPWRRRDGTVLYFEGEWRAPLPSCPRRLTPPDNAGCIVNPKGESKGSGESEPGRGVRARDAD